MLFEKENQKAKGKRQKAKIAARLAGFLATRLGYCVAWLVAREMAAVEKPARVVAPRPVAEPGWGWSHQFMVVGMGDPKRVVALVPKDVEAELALRLRVAGFKERMLRGRV